MFSYIIIIYRIYKMLANENHIDSLYGKKIVHPLNFKFENQKNTSNQIPRLLHLIWVGDTGIPDFLISNIKKWSELMPTWQIRLWTNQDINSNEFQESTLKLINLSTKGAQKADIMRYYIIEKYGGVYMDADMTPNRSLESLISNLTTQTILCHDIELTWQYISIGFFAAVAHHKLFQRACEICHNVELNTQDIHMTTGPRLLGEALTTVNLDNEEKIIVLPYYYFYYNNNFNDRFATHEYKKMW